MNNAQYSVCIDSAVGKLILESTIDALTGIRFTSDDKTISEEPHISPILATATEQLLEYFNGVRTNFDLPLNPSGTKFQQQVWEKLMNIPYGISITYKKLAQNLGDASKVRAVGRANGQNPIPIIVPCHRVIGVNNKLTGYAGGIERKRWLLKHEGILLL